MTKEDYEKLGWEFKEKVWYDGHNNDRNVTQLFKSPRMEKFRDFNGIEGLTTIESCLIAWDVLQEDFELRHLISVSLAEYYFNNPNTTKIPKVKVTIDE